MSFATLVVADCGAGARDVGGAVDMEA